MRISTFVVSYTHTVTYVTTKMLFLLKEIIREIGLDPANFANDWNSCERAISAWLASRHLEGVRLEVYDPRTDRLVTAWGIDVVYDTIGDGTLWVDADAVRYAIAKAGLVPSACRYEIKITNRQGRPDVYGWYPCQFRSTAGFRRYSLGATIGGNGLSAQTAYWSK